MQVGRFRDRTSAKNRALVSIPPWLFPMPGANALYYVKAVLVHEGRYINGGHYTLFKREGPAEADTAQDAVEDVESEAEGADEADAGHEEGTLGLESMAIDESDEQVAEKLGRSVEDLKKLGMNKRKRQAKDKAHQERIESAASFQLWKKYEDDKLTTRVPWAKIEVSSVELLWRIHQSPLSWWVRR